jgi:hypothetical protein
MNIGMFGMNGFSFIFGLFPFLFLTVFVLILVMIIYTISVNARQNHRNNQSPVLTVNATVVSKRTDVTHYHHAGNVNSMNHMNSTTWYYTTFQVESGDRMELSMSGTDFGMLAEGDQGRLTFQGTRYIRFERGY